MLRKLVFTFPILLFSLLSLFLTFSFIFLCSLLKERFKEAEEIYQAGIKNCPDSSDLHNNYGVFLVDTGE